MSSQEIQSPKEKVDNPAQWYVLRDLKRPNAKLPAYIMLRDAGFEIFTPMTTIVTTRAGRKTSVERPLMQDLLFVRSDKPALDTIILSTPTLQYRYGQGNNFNNPMTVSPQEMNRFRAALQATLRQPNFYLPGQIPRAMLGRRARLRMAGPLDGYECRILSIRGARNRHLLVELPGLLSAEIEVAPDLIEII